MSVFERYLTVWVAICIVVGVALDTLQQIESHLIMRHYEGFLKKGKLRGRNR